MTSNSSMPYYLVLSLILHPYLINAQQPYGGSTCTTDDNSTSVLGYKCNGANRTCQTFLVYLTQPPYNTISSIASLLSANATRMSVINNVEVNVPLKSYNEVIVPVTCSCSDPFYQANTTYVFQSDYNFNKIHNSTFEGLTTCNAIRAQNPSLYPENVRLNKKLTIPLRCACPTSTQIGEGINYLMTYVIQGNQSIYLIAKNLGADVEQTLQANEKSEEDSIIQPFTTLLVPLRSLSFTTHPTPLNKTQNKPQKSRIIIISVSITIIAIVLLIIGAWLFMHRRKSAKPSPDLEELIIDIDSLKFDFKTIRDATNNFSVQNKLGQGGFGGVYKGKLENGQEIAVKRLSSNSGQGVEEFKTEVLLLAKLQHKNLVKLLGFCIYGDEKLLVYEFLPNASLDKILFLDHKSRPPLDWQTRYQILLGTARGLLYLHEDSRLKIIHRDLKLSNILLDEEMNPKVGDFGLARLVGRDQIEAETSRIAGTLGYMAPEYFFGGRFSIKSDIYSFGVIALEIVTGEACYSSTSSSLSRNDDSVNENLSLRTWKFWKSHAISSLVDSRLDGNYIFDEVKRCIHIGLLCIQEDARKRPMMGLIVSALNGHQLVLPEPESPFIGLPKGINYSSSTGLLK